MWMLTGPLQLSDQVQAGGMASRSGHPDVPGVGGRPHTRYTAVGSPLCHIPTQSAGKPPEVTVYITGSRYS